MPKAPVKPKQKRITKPKDPKPASLTADQKPKKLPDVWHLSAAAIKLLIKYKRLFIGIVLIYGVINFALAKGFSAGADPASLKQQVTNLFHGQYKQLASGLSVFALMLASAGSTSNGGSFGYELFLIILVSLALIWAIRNTTNQTAVKIREAYYRGMYPLVPFICILLVISLEMLPMIVGLSLYALTAYNNIAVNALELSLFGVIAAVLSVLTLYLVGGSLFALYIVTLPDMTPIKALRSAKNLVKNRRFVVLLRVLYLPVALLIISAVIMLPVILFASVIAQWVFLVLSLIFIALIHSYLYNLYRELLINEQA